MTMAQTKQSIVANCNRPANQATDILASTYSTMFDHTETCLGSDAYRVTSMLECNCRNCPSVLAQCSNSPCLNRAIQLDAIDHHSGWHDDWQPVTVIVPHLLVTQSVLGSCFAVPGQANRTEAVEIVFYRDLVDSNCLNQPTVVTFDQAK